MSLFNNNSMNALWDKMDPATAAFIASAFNSTTGANTGANANAAAAATLNWNAWAAAASAAAASWPFSAGGLTQQQAAAYAACLFPGYGGNYGTQQGTSQPQQQQQMAAAAAALAQSLWNPAMLQQMFYMPQLQTQQQQQGAAGNQPPSAGANTNTSASSGGSGAAKQPANGNQTQFVRSQHKSGGASSSQNVAMDLSSPSAAKGDDKRSPLTPASFGPGAQATCRLCRNRITASRLSNLTNHVRRHALLKQFQCCHCDYAHNEMAKVRLHMLHNHRDKDTSPKDNLSPEMQAQWDLLMEQCFPEFAAATAASKSQNEDNVANAGTLDAKACKSSAAPSGVTSTTRHTCTECGELVAANSAALLAHVRAEHNGGSASPGDGDAQSSDVTTQQLLSIYFPTAAGDAAIASGTAAMEVDASVKENGAAAKTASVKSNKVAANGNRGGTPPKRAGPYVDLRCELCHKVMPGPRSVSSLLSHAKRHYHVKQFACAACTYTSAEATHVRSHMKLKHPSAKMDPVDNKTAAMQQAWVSITARCFPAADDELKYYRFKDPIEDASANSSSGVTAAAAAENRSNDAVATENDTDNTNSADGSNPSAANGTACAIAATLAAAAAAAVTNQPHKSTSASGIPNTTSATGAVLPLDDGPVACRLCKQSVPKSDMCTHAASHMPGTATKYTCDQCDFSTGDYQALKSHEWKHRTRGGAGAAAGHPNVQGHQHGGNAKVERIDKAVKVQYMKMCFGEEKCEL